MKKINQSPPDYPNYVIRYCTNNGVWVVDQQDPLSGLTLESYDFVNKEYTGPMSQGQAEPFASCSPEQQQTFDILHKELNKDLLASKKQDAPQSADSGVLSFFHL